MSHSNVGKGDCFMFRCPPPAILLVVLAFVGSPLMGYTVVILQPQGTSESQSGRIGGDQQAGEVDGHATIWTGSAGSAIDLHPAGYKNTFTYATDGHQQVGTGLTNNGGG